MTSLVLQALMRLPGWLQVRLSGRPPITDGTDTLHPEMQLILALSARGERRPPGSAIEERAAFRHSQLLFGGRAVRVGSVTDLVIPTPAGNLPARHYAPGGAGRPLLVYYHGGGFAVGDRDTHDRPCRRLCKEAGVHVLSVEYRLAPEHPFPAAVDDADAAFGWAAANAESLGADPARVGVGGDSAGGNLAAVVALLRKDQPVRPTLQLLLYPAADRTRDNPSVKRFAAGFLLTAASIDRYTRWYAAGHDLTDIRLSPIYAADLSGLPPAVVVTAGFDPLRDEGEALAAALKAAGNTVRAWRVPLLHGFVNMAGFSPACRRATEDAARAVRELWEGGR